MKLGEAIGPSPQAAMSQVLEDAVAQVLREKGDSAALMKAAIESLNTVATKLVAVADQQAAATTSLASAARALEMRAGIAPVVNLTVPEAPEHEAPIVNVTVPVPSVTVSPEREPDGPEVTIRTVERDANGLITRIIESNG